MPIITLGTSKGGAGKSTLCTNLIIQHVQRDPDTALIDADSQRSASTWSSLRESLGVEPGVLTMEKTFEGEGRDFAKQLLRLNEKYNSIFIDVAGRNSPELRASLLISDLLVMPLRPSNFDLWALTSDMQLISECRLNNERLKVLIVFNGVSTHSKAGPKEIRDLTDYLTEYLDDSTTIAKTTIYNRSIFVKAVADGSAVTELKASDAGEKAAAEIKALYAEIEAIIGIE